MKSSQKIKFSLVRIIKQKAITPLAGCKRAFLSVVMILCIAPNFAYAQAVSPKVLRVSAIPDEAPTELQRKFKPLGEYLSTAIGMKVEFTAVNDYPAVVEALAGKKIDMAWLGGFTYVQAKRLTNGAVIPIIQRAEDQKFTSKIIVPKESTAKTLSDLKGFTFAFGSPSSTSGHLMPRFYLSKAGINPDVDFKSIAFSGAHDATLAYVASGRVQAGAMNASVWDKLVEGNNTNTQRVRVLYTTPTFFDYNWTIRSDLDPAVIEKIKSAFLALDPANSAHKELMELQRASKYVTTQSSNYDSIEQAGLAAGLIK